MVGDFAAIHVQAGEDRSVEGTSHRFVTARVQLVRVVEEVKRGQEHLSAGLQLAGSGFQLPRDLLPLRSDAVDLVAQLVLRPAFLCGQVEEVAFFAVQLVELPGELGAHLVGEFILRAHGGFHACPHRVAQVFGQDDRVGVVLFNRLFHDIDGHIGVVAEFLLPSPADEIEVRAAVAASRHDGVAVLAAPAPDHTLEVMGVLPFAGAAARVRVEHALYPVEQFFADHRFVSALVLNALVGDFSYVVAVAQHLAERFAANRLVLAGCPQVEVGHDFPEAIERVQAGTHQLKCFAHQWGALFVKGHGVHLAAVDVDAHVGVAELGFADRAAVARFVAHFGGNVLAAEFDLYLVHDVGDRFHGLGHDAFAELFACRDELDAAIIKHALSDARLKVVTEGTRAHVDEDVLYLRVLFEVLQKLAENLALGDAEL